MSSVYSLSMQCDLLTLTYFSHSSDFNLNWHMPINKLREFSAAVIIESVESCIVNVLAFSLNLLCDFDHAFYIPVNL